MLPMHRFFLWIGFFAVLGLILAPQAALAAGGGTVLPSPPKPFAGKIGADVQHSVPAYPANVSAPAGAPNIVLVLTDDVGFAAASTFGGPIPTPHLDQLAARGLKYNAFHTTAMCSPTRASLLTGRNHHSVGSGTIVELSTGYPGYWSVIPRSAASVAEILRYNGYNTAFFGKHHNVPLSQGSAAGPFDLWPTGLGFEYFYGFVGGEMDQWNPVLFRGTSRVDLSHKDHDYILDRDLADDAIHWIHNQKAAAPAKPFFLYYAPGSAHSPHQAPAEWVKKFRGQYDQGWDKLREEIFARQKASGVIPASALLTPRPEGIPAWESLSSDRKRVSARLMEVYAAMLAYQDAQIGRLLDELERMGQLENTLVIFIEGDNGASAEGGVDGMSNNVAMQVNRGEESMGWLLKILDELGGKTTHEHYPVGWAWALNTPFPWLKQYASHLGGVRNGLVVSWPARIKKTGEVRPQYAHVIDIMPTILEAVGVAQPDIVNGVKQQRVDGISMLYTFDNASAPDRRKTQYFEMLGNRSLYHDGWLASTTPKRKVWDFSLAPLSEQDYAWELYNLRDDYSQARNLASQEPARLKEMQALWMEEARRNNVLPVDDRMVGRLGGDGLALAARDATYLYWGGNISVTHGVSPALPGRSFSITAEVELPATKGHGVLVADGSKFGGWSFYLEDGKPVAHHAFSQQPKDQYRVASSSAIPAGPALIRYAFDYDGGVGKGGTMRISVNGEQVAGGRIERTVNMPEFSETFDIGQDTGGPVVPAYEGRDRFSGAIKKVEVALEKLNYGSMARP